jgi:polar amino acid transport system substrate-binding protein
MGQGPDQNRTRHETGMPAALESSPRRRRFLLLIGLAATAAVSAAVLILAIRGSEEDGLDRVHRRGALTWGADQEGGGPYVYPRPEDPKQVTGFEVDLMNLLAERLGVRAQFQQCEWTNLPDLLRIGGIDCITNGYELTEAHLASKIATIPYYVYELQLVARRDNQRMKSWVDLVEGGARKKVGVLSGSAAEAYVRKRLGDHVEIVGYQGTTDTLQDVVNGRLDATVQDLPPLIFYQNRFSQLHFVEVPVGRGYYVMYLRPGEERLRDELNAALRDLIRGGQLRVVYERYGLWNVAQEELGKADLGIQQSIQARGWEVITQNLPILLQAAGITVLLAVLAMPLAIGIGLIVALGRLYGPAVIRVPLAAYVEILRGTPLLLQLYTIFFVLPALGVRISAFPAAVLGLAINYSAYEAEIYRAGLQAIPVSQLQAALALGMSRRQALFRIVIPQAMRLVIPPVTNDFVALFKDTSICSVITIVELTKRYNILANSTGAYLQLAALTALLYLLMSYPLSLLARRLEGRVHRQVL